MTQVARCIGSGATLIILGVVLTVGWYLSHLSITHTITNDEIRDQLVIDSVDSKGYYDWMEGNAINNYNYYIYYGYNITNPNELLTTGAKPIYEQVGPYYYKYIWYNMNASFLDDGNIVQYNLLEDYIFDPELSVGDPTKDLFYMFNPAYVTILATAGGDGQVALISMLPFIGSFIDFCSGEFLEVVSSQYMPGVINTTLSSIYSFLSPSFRNNQTLAAEYFYQNWGSGNPVPMQLINWPGMFPNISNSSAIPVSSVASLFSNDVSFSFLDTSIQAYMTWFLASNNENGTEAQLIQNTFSLSSDQLHSILIWRNTSFIPSYVRPLVMAQGQKYYPVSTWEDLGWVQFVHMGFTTPNSLVDVYYNYYSTQFPQEFELDYKFPGMFGIGQVKLLLNGPVGVLNVVNFGEFSGVNNGDYSAWGVNQAQAMTFEGYMAGLAQNYSIPFITSLINNGETGLLLKNSFDYWLWRCSDALVNFLVGPSQAYCGLQINNSVQAPSQTFTGKHDLSKLGEYVMWRGVTSVDYWSVPVNVSGHTAAGQFSPGVKDNQTLYVWDESFVKPLELNPVGKTKVKDIDVITYVLNPDAYAVSKLYTNTIQGFANESALNQAPIFLSNFDFYGADPKYGNYSGVNTSNHQVITIYVEPNTGATLQADETLQVNMYYPKGADQWNELFPQFGNVPSDAMYPLLKLYQKSQIGDARARKLKDQLVYFEPPFNLGILWGLFSFGIVLFVAGILMIIRGFTLRHHRKHHGYDDIN